MGLQELILEAIEELGDPDELANNEDLIILKLEQACTNKRMLPEDIGLGGDERRLSMNQQAFVTYRAFLGNLRYSAALFAGCSEFSSSKAFLETAKYVLKNVRTLVLVHNRNRIFNLVTWFPTVPTIVLHHNLRLHAETGVTTNVLTRSRVEQLLGTMPALGLDHLSLSTHALQSLFNKCPKLASVMSSDLDAALSAKKVINIAPKRPPVPIRRKALFLGRTCIHYTGIPIQFTARSADAVEKAHQHFPEAEHLELTAACESAIGKVASYTKVTHLSLFSAMPKDKSPFEPHVTEVLSVLRLVHLSLTHFCDVRLSVIAKLCPQLKFLGIRACGVDDEGDTAANFSKLEHLRLGSAMKEESFFKLLKSCPGLRELEIDKDELTAAFIVGPPASCGERPILEHVERLTLRTNTDWFGACSLDDVEELPSDLDLTLACLPSLRRVRTDNYDIRLHINSCFPNIALDWCLCTLCASEFPKINELQGNLYRCAQQLQLPRPVEYVHINAQDKTRVQLKAEVSVDMTEEEPKVEEVAVDTKDDKTKAEEAGVNIKDEKIKPEVLVDSKREEVNAEVPVDAKEEKMKAQAPTDHKKEIMKAEVVPVDAKDDDVKAEEFPVDIQEDKMKAEEVAFDAKEGEMKHEVPVNIQEDKMKAEEVAVDAKEDEMKHEVPVDTEEEKMTAEDVQMDIEENKMKAVALVDTKEELKKAEAPVHSYNAVIKVEVVILDAKGKQVTEEDVKARMKQEKLKVNVLEDNKEEKMKPEEVIQVKYEARRSKSKEGGKVSSERETMANEENEVLVALPSLTEQQAVSEAEAGGTNTVPASERVKVQYKSLEEPD